MMKPVLYFAALAIMSSFPACSDDPGPPGMLEIGTRNADGDFVPWNDSEPVAVVLGPNGLNMIVPSLRAFDINPRGPEPTVHVAVGGLLMAADLKPGGTGPDMTSLGEGGYALWELRVPFQTDLCCYNCAIGTVTASITDRTGRQFTGEVDIQLSRDECPAPTVCCNNVNACPDPSLTQVCE